jgi:hypothetical protein
MDIVEEYGKLIKKRLARKPESALRMFKAGLFCEGLRVRRIPEKKLPRALRALNSMALDSVRKALAAPEQSVWVNFFAPVEILQCFGLTPLSVECFSAFTAGFRVEDYFTDLAAAAGLSDTLCSYHKNFIGVMDSGVLPRPLMALATTLACDCNANTFRHIGERTGAESRVLDIPYEYSPDAEKYVLAQLLGLISDLERLTGRKFREESLREIIERENVCRELRRSPERESHSYDRLYVQIRTGRNAPRDGGGNRIFGACGNGL